MIVHKLSLALLIVTVSAASLCGEEEPTSSHNVRRVKTRWIRQLARLRPPDINERSHYTVKEAFHTVVAQARKSTARILANDLQVAMGTIVRRDGYIISKASELNGELECMLVSGRRYPAKIVGRSVEYDIALLKIPADGLVAAKWSTAKPIVGGWLATVGIGPEPSAIGVVSSAPRPIPTPRAALGIHMDGSGDGVRISKILPDSSASRARLQVGDVILMLNKQPIDDTQKVRSTIRQLRPGDRMEVRIRRDEHDLVINVILGDYERLAQNSQADIMDSLGGPLSNRRTGFPLALQHDTVLRPRDCGGPVVDLTGRVAGINIARASRVASYAIPGDAIQKLLSQLLSEPVEQHVATSQGSEP